MLCPHFLFTMACLLLDLNFLCLIAYSHQVQAGVIHGQVEACGVRATLGNHVALHIEHVVIAAYAGSSNLNVSTDCR